jgi:hypothetical protein
MLSLGVIFAVVKDGGAFASFFFAWRQFWNEDMHNFYHYHHLVVFVRASFGFVYCHSPRRCDVFCDAVQRL